MLIATGVEKRKVHNILQEKKYVSQRCFILQKAKSPKRRRRERLQLQLLRKLCLTQLLLLSQASHLLQKLRKAEGRMRLKLLKKMRILRKERCGHNRSRSAWLPFGKHDFLIAKISHL